MKNLIFIFLISVSNCFSQTIVESGRIDSTGNLIYLSESEINKSFDWYVGKDSTVGCYIYDTSDNAVDSLSWFILDVDASDIAVRRYSVLSPNGKAFLLNFYDKDILIVNIQTLEYSMMYGDDVNYENVLNDKKK